MCQFIARQTDLNLWCGRCLVRVGSDISLSLTSLLNVVLLFKCLTCGPLHLSLLASAMFDICYFPWLVILYSPCLFTSFNLYLRFLFSTLCFFSPFTSPSHTSFVLALVPIASALSFPPLPQPLSVYIFSGVCSCWSLIPKLNGL